MQLDTLTIIGVGLIGGSIGVAARQRKLARRVLGVGRAHDGVNRALDLGAIDEASLDPEAAVRAADLVVICTPVDQIAATVLQLAPHCRSGAILTDSGSTKSDIVRSLDGNIPAGVHFVGGHPLAGSEKQGVEHANGKLFQDRVAVLTVTEHTDAVALQRVSEFWQQLGSRVRVMNPDDHDRAVATTSHLPHLVSSVLASLLVEEVFDLAATGFRDTTRIAAGDPAIWAPILLQNRAAILNSLKCFRASLDSYERVLANEDTEALKSLLEFGKRRRDALGN